jgi:hypothetical protein
VLGVIVLRIHHQVTVKKASILFLKRQLVTVKLRINKENISGFITYSAILILFANKDKNTNLLKFVYCDETPKKIDQIKYNSKIFA